MFLDDLRDANIYVYGDNSKISDRVQAIATRVVSLLPRMGSSMVVSVSHNALRLTWHPRRTTFIVEIAPDLVVTVSSRLQGLLFVYACKNGDSSDLVACLKKGLLKLQQPQPVPEL